jgi:hypothetical protein
VTIRTLEWNKLFAKSSSDCRSLLGGIYPTGSQPKTEVGIEFILSSVRAVVTGLDEGFALRRDREEGVPNSESYGSLWNSCAMARLNDIDSHSLKLYSNLDVTVISQNRLI